MINSKTIIQCAETNFALVKIHQKANIKHEAVVGHEAVHGHVIDLGQVEVGDTLISRALKTISIMIFTI